jgi:hypothetical protein
MAKNILVDDDDALMRRSLAFNLERKHLEGVLRVISTAKLLLLRQNTPAFHTDFS